MVAPPVTVVGAGLAGCEAAVSLSRQGICVDLIEMKPVVYSPAHSLPGPAELVCSNSLKSDAADTAHGLLKWEMRRLSSVVLEAADRTRVPAGTALAVDRQAFSKTMEVMLSRHPNIRYRSGEEIKALPEGEVVVATGPLTSGPLVNQLLELAGGGTGLYFFDALAPILSAETIDRNIAYPASRWGRGEAEDYLNCPMTEAEYQRFLQALKKAPRTAFREFESERYFEGCLPVEVMADRGDNTLAHGPMRPVGLEVGGCRSHAVVQLRLENREKTAYNMVGFQTKLTIPSQREVFRLIPGLEHVEFLRYGAVHRNVYVHAPKVLDEHLCFHSAPRVRLAGQLTGVEGYMESAAIGWLVGWMMGRESQGNFAEPPPAETALGALYAHLRKSVRATEFEPMNIHFGLLPPLPGNHHRDRRKRMIERAHDAFDAWLRRAGLQGGGG
jgi:methylenetetrahydrofolate--tRNA-(uracil-5-)-methyltransferase